MKASHIFSLTALLVLTLFGTTLYTSCKKDPCDSIRCLNNGACNNGKCVCPTGFTGTYCETTITPPAPDPCKNVTCQNGGVCDSGVCKCPTGYEGTYCESKNRDKFIKSWTAADVASSSALHYTVIISSGANVTEATISPAFSDNFFTHSIAATVSGKTITVTKQNPDGDRYSVEGSGTYTSDNNISWTYTLKNDSTGQTINYSGIWQ